MKRPVRITLLSVGVLCLLLIGAEVAASFTLAGNAASFVEDKDIFLTRKPDQHGYTMGNGRWIACHINKVGLRGDDLPEPRPAGERWILCVGDSFTFGGGVEENEAWPQRVQALLGPPETSGVRVLNAGANGWDTRWQRHYLEARALDDLQPDVLVLGWNWNDLTMNPAEDIGPVYVSRFLEARGSWLEPFARFAFLRETHLYRWFYARQVGADVVPGPKALERSYADYARNIEQVGIAPETAVADMRKRRFGNQPPDLAFWQGTDTAVWKLVRSEMSRIQAACAARGITFVVAMLPEPTWTGAGTFPGTERLTAMLDALGVASVDVQPDFMSSEPHGTTGRRRPELWLRYDPVHPVPEGHEIMAERVLGLLRDADLVPSAPH